MADLKLKKFNGTSWEDAYPETTVGQIVATGTPSSTTFLRGDGTWASVEESGNQFVNITGDTMTGTLTASGGINGLTLSNGISGNNFNITGVNQISINDPGEGIVFQGTTNVTQYIIDDANDNIMNFQNLNEMRVNGSKVWHAGNDGSGSGLDADLLDGLDSASFLRSNTTDYYDRLLQSSSGTPTSNLGSPSVTEMALFEEQFNNKTAFYPIEYLKFYTSTDGTNWTEYTSFSDTDKRKFLGGDNNSNINIPNLTPYFRIELENKNSYVYLNALYMYWSSQSHSTKVHIYKQRASDDAWIQHTSSTNTVSSWPGHMYLPFSTIPFLGYGSTSSNHYYKIRIQFEPTWSGHATYGDRPILLYRMQLWGGYPAGKQRLFHIDENQNVNFPANITLSGTVDGVDVAALSTTVGGKVSKAGDTMTGNLTMGTNTIYGDITTTKLNLSGAPAELVTVRSMEIRADDDDSSNTEYLKLMAGQNTLQITSTSGGGTDNSKLTYNGNQLLTPITGAKRIDLTSQVQLADYRKSVIALCDLTNTNPDSNSWSGGTFYFHRTNGLSAPVTLQIAMEKRYNSVGANYTALVMSGNSFGDNIQYIKFQKDGVWYGGIEFYFSDANHAQVYFIGETNFDIFGLDYYNTQTSTVLNSEVNNSITSSDITAETDFFFNNQTIWHAGNDGSGSGLDADTLDTYQASQFLRSDQDDTMSGNLTLTNTQPRLILTDTDHNSDFHIQNANGIFTVGDTTNQEDRFEIDSSGNVDILSGDLTVNGNLVVEGDNRYMTFGTPGAGTTTGARFLSIEGNTDSSGEGSGRIFFTEHNSTTASMDNYGMSIGYRGGDTTIAGASGNTWTGLSQIGNGEWGMWGHNNDASGALIMSGDRTATYVNFHSNELRNATLASPALTGTPTAPTATAGTNTTQIATTAFVSTAVSNLVNGADAAFDTLKEIQDAMATDTELSTAISNLSIPSNTSDLTNDSGFITGITSSDVTTALGYTPYNSTNPSGYITGINSTDVTTALGFTPYNATNPSGYITGITSSDVTTALGFTPYNATNPSGYITGINSTDVTTALGYTPYNSTNPNGYISDYTVTSSDVTTALGYTPYNATNPNGYISDYTVTSSDVTTALGYTPYNATNPSGYISDYTVTKSDVDTALGTAAANDAYFYRGDGTWAAASGGTSDPQGGIFSTDGGTSGLTSNGWVNGYASTTSWSGTSGTTTPSSGTGPTSDTSVSGFIYTEASGVASTSHKIAIDLGDSLPRQLKFKYHMYGAAMGTLNIIADSTTLLTLSGDQGDVWTEKTVDIPAEAHTLIIEGVTGTTFTSDICIADIEIVANRGPLRAVKDWAGTLTVSGTSTVATVTEDLLGKLIAVELTDTSGASDETSLVFMRLNTNTTYSNFVHNVSGASYNLVYTSYFGIARTSATGVTFYQPKWTYESYSTGSPSNLSANISNEILYIHNIYIVEGV